MAKYNLDTFVNITSKQVGTVVDDYAAGKFDALRAIGLDTNAAVLLLQAEFANTFSYDTINDQASPVRVFERAGVPIAWYDTENCYGVAVY